MQNLEENCTYLSEKKLSLVREFCPSGGALDSLSALFSAFSDKTRVRIVSALSISEMCVGDLCSALSLNQTTASHQLAYLKSCGVVEDERRGRVVFYRIKHEKILTLLLAAAEIV
jgi:ArsR family transcriptional regulator